MTDVSNQVVAATNDRYESNECEFSHAAYSFQGLFPFALLQEPHEGRRFERQ
jgi:hypothetical protein